jgi:[ribosomal protein S5]-alanine N-acetyltransferase
MDALPELSTRRLRLWIAGAEDASELLRYHEENREHLMRWSPPVPPDLYTLAYWQARLVRNRREHVDDRSARFVLAWRDTPDRVIGTCSLTDFVRGPFQACTLGYGLDRREQGKGAMTEALRAIIDFVFGPLALHRIMANYMPTNTRSGALLRRLGFTVEGYARDYLFINGAWRDHILTALTNPAPRPPAR